MEEQRRQTTEAEAAARRATDAQVRKDAERRIAAWNERQAQRMPTLFSPTIGAAITARSGEPLKSCTMVICGPNDFVAEVHGRMPVLLREKDFEPWLSGTAGIELLKPALNDLLQK